MFDYKYAYLLGDCFIFIGWLFCFLLRNDLRKKIIIISILGAIAGVITEPIFLIDYWKPATVTGWPISFEDFLFGFFIGGIGGVLYEEIFRKSLAKKRRKKHHIEIFLSPLMVLAVIGIGHITIPTYKINSIYATILVFIIAAFLIVKYRADLWKESLLSGIFLGIYFTIFYIIMQLVFPEMFIRFWYLKNLSGLTLFNIPIEEILWAFFCGMFVGPFYEYWFGISIKKME